MVTTIVIRMIMVVVLITMAMGRRKVVVMVNMMAMRRRKMVVMVVVVKEAEGAAGFGEHSPAAADHESFPGFPHNFYHGK